MAKTDKKKPTTKTKRARGPAAKPTKLKPPKAKTAKTKPSRAIALLPPPPLALDPSAAVLDRLWGVVRSRRNADPAVSHSARLLSRGTAKVAQKFGEEAVECLIEAVSGTHEGLIGESADVLYHLLVMWVDADLRPEDVWAELQRREGISGIAEKAARAKPKPLTRPSGTRKIP